ncbi:ABC transporter ATP-binding protein [Bailinhaonella thermotolerans]|uniref:ABC transporter ATP-binding protein n=1 Tax=Bailinhaonella thermotolerans TaxID=1070861 RepID=UPI00192A5BAF|nr:ABC transporter ATP-binding protein [Bailinhaonella thermotolerans]
MTTRRILRLLRPHRWALLAVVLLAAVFSALTAAIPLLTQAVIDRALFGPGGPRPGLLAAFAGLAALAALAAAGVGLLQAWISGRTAHRIVHSLRVRLFGHLQRLPLGFFATAQGGEVQSRLANDTTQIEESVKESIPAFLGGLLGFVFALGAMFTLSWQLAVVTVGLAPVVLYVSARTTRALRDLSAAGQESRAAIASIAAERLSLGGVTLARVHAREGDEAAAFTAESGRLAALGVRAAVATQAVLSAGHVFFVLAPYAVFAAAGLLDGVTPGTLIAFVVLQARLHQPLWQLLQTAAEYRTAEAALDRVFAYLDLAPAPAVRPEPAARPGEVAVAGLSFAYGGAEPALRDIALDLAPGTAALVVGPSGSGKTTLGHLLAGLHPPGGGTVRVGGPVCLAPQEPVLFQGTIAENLRYAAPGATLGELAAACRTTGIHERIEALPDGYESVVGERGALLSGGERQRVALARALLSGAPVLVLDEATSALDPVTENQVIEAVLAFRAGLTTIMITHRLRAPAAFDTVIVLNRGRVAESGPHPALLTNPHGLYTRLLRAQSA